jgi:Holliday junction resolvase
MNRYRAGQTFEHCVRDDLRSRGFLLVVRAAGSKGPVDLVAARLNELLLVQCKRSLRCDPEEWNALFTLAAACGAGPLVAGRPGRGRLKYMRLLAAKNGGGGPQPWESYDP